MTEDEETAVTAWLNLLAAEAWLTEAAGETETDE